MSLNSTKTPQKHEKSCFSLLFLFSLGALLLALLKVVGFFKQGNGVVRISKPQHPLFVFSLVSIIFRGLTFP
jgi:hypothetical protein